MAEEIVTLITVPLYFLSEMTEKDCKLSIVLKLLLQSHQEDQYGEDVLRYFEYLLARRKLKSESIIIFYRITMCNKNFS